MAATPLALATEGKAWLLPHCLFREMAPLWWTSKIHGGIMNGFFKSKKTKTWHAKVRPIESLRASKRNELTHDLG